MGRGSIALGLLSCGCLVPNPSWDGEPMGDAGTALASEAGDDGDGEADGVDGSGTMGVDGTGPVMTGGPGTSSTGSADCDAGAHCIGVAAPWQGPVVIDVGNTPNPGCTEPDYPSVVAGAPLDAVWDGNPCCQCTTTSPTCDATLTQYSGAECTDELAVSDATVCHDLDTLEGLSARISIGTSRAQTCTPVALMPQAVITSQAVLCGGATPLGACDGGQCFMAPADHAVCVWAEGDHSCPAGYPTRYALVDVVNELTCPPCSCIGDDLPCTGTVSVYDGLACGGLAVTGPDNDACFAPGVLGPGMSIQVDLVEPLACAVEPGAEQPSGVISLEVAGTVCCAA